MQAESKEKLRAIAGQLEGALRTFESILEEESLAPLYRASHGVEDALKALHGLEPSLLTPEGGKRVEALLRSERKQGRGRDDFNTGF